MTSLRKTLVAGLAGIALIAAGAVAAPSQAEAKHKLFAAGAIGFGLGLALAAPVYGAPVYGAPVYQPTCWWKKQFTGYYDAYGNPVYQKIQVCG
jgi:hypothetical protein